MQKKISSNQLSFLKKNTLKYKKSYRKGDFPNVNYESLMKNWGLELISYKKIRAVLKVETKEGTFGCKLFKYDLNLFNFILEAIHHLKRNGLDNIMDVVPTIKREYYHQDAEGNIFFLMPWINGREANLYNSKELFRGAQLMAKFHLASDNFNPNNKAKIPNSWGHWPEKFSTSLNSMKKVQEIIENKTEVTQIDTIVLNSWQYYYDLTARAIKTIEGSDYKKYVKKAKRSCSLCHCDFTYHNLLFTPNDELHLIDFDFLRCDTRTLDIGKFLRKELPHFNYDFDICELILRAYKEINPLEKNEYPLIMALLLYPNKYMVNVLDLYINNKERPSKVILHRLKRILEERNSLDKFLKKFEAKYL